jgi:hypothetical protein
MLLGKGPQWTNLASRLLFGEVLPVVTFNRRVRKPGFVACSKSTLTGERRMRGKKPKPRLHVPDYCEVDTVKDGEGKTIWPAPVAAMDEARALIREW